MSQEQAQAFGFAFASVDRPRIEKLLEEYGSILDDIAEREAILADPERRLR